MTSWRPSSGPGTAKRRAAILRRLRDHFETSNTLEVDTPALSRYAVSDPQIETFQVHRRSTDAPLYLHTSPEFCMKRLIAAGYPDIFSICRVFRDDDASKRHQPEFTMVEWYRLGFGLDQIVSDTITTISAALDQPALTQHVTRMDYRDVFLESIGVDPIGASVADLANAANADSRLRTAIGDERDDWLDLIVSTQISATFPKDSLTVLQHYPASQAALAQYCPSNASVADRFEVFIGSNEVANGYVELTDAEEQVNRITKDQEGRKRRGRPLRPSDEALVAALNSGLPDSAGVAMGLERLQMIHDKTDDIRDVVTFVFED